MAIMGRHTSRTACGVLGRVEAPARPEFLLSYLDYAQNLRNTRFHKLGQEADVAAATQLPEPRTDTLKRAPLELVVCQVRHEPLEDVSDARRMLALQTHLGNGFIKLEPQLSAELSLGSLPGGDATPPALKQSMTGWRLTTPEGGWIVTVSRDSFAIESTQYTSWTEFRTLLGALVEATVATFNPQLINRIGVRYMDRIWREGSTIPVEWQKLLSPGVLGLANCERLSPYVAVAQTYNELAIGEYRANVRGSIASDNTPNKYSMVLDTDCFDERSVAFDTANLMDVVADLHVLSLQLFQEVVTPDLYAELLG